jgi:hypothetical protein
MNQASLAYDGQEGGPYWFQRTYQRRLALHCDRTVDGGPTKGDL